MSKCNDDFFVEKKEWSRVKDTLLAAYLPAYFAKILASGKPTVYIDCFAGAGRFENGEPGSPIIALMERVNALNHTKAQSARLDMYFIEPKFVDELKGAIQPFAGNAQCGKTEVVAGEFQDKIRDVVKQYSSANIFLYIDPFGVKSLDFNLVCELAGMCENRIEMLVNFNSFGFIRAACRACEITEVDLEDGIDLEEREEFSFDDELEPVKLLSRIVGGDYWQDYILELKTLKRDKKVKSPAVDVERRLSHAVKEHLEEKFRYVLDIPVCVKTKSYPKYRLVHVCNHPAGCVLMADNMIKRSGELFHDVQNKSGQGYLFEMNAAQDFVDRDQIEDGVIKSLERLDAVVCESCKKAFKITGMLRIHHAKSTLLADFFNRNGVMCSSSDVVDALKALQKRGVIEVKRDPATGCNGQPLRYWTEGKGRSLTIKLADDFQGRCRK